MARLPSRNQNSPILRRNLSKVSPIAAENVLNRQARRLAEDDPSIMVDLEDGLGPRPLADVLREADEEIAAAGGIQASAIGNAANENGDV